MEEEIQPNRTGSSNQSAFDYLGGEMPVTEYRASPPVKPPKKRARPPVEPAPEMSDMELARRIELGAAAAYAMNIVTAGLGDTGGINAMQNYMRSMIAQSVDSDDPLQKLLMELQLLSFHRVATLHSRSAMAQTPEASIAYSGAACKLSAEFRKSTLALRELQRVPMESGILVKRTLTVEKGASSPPAKEKPNTELISKTNKVSAMELPGETNNNTQPTPSTSRKRKSEKTEGTIQSGANSDAEKYSYEETMVAIKRAANGRG